MKRLFTFTERSKAAFAATVVFGVWSSGCSGSSNKSGSTSPKPRNESRSGAEPDARPEPPSRPVEPARPREDMQIKGLLGTIDQETVAKAFRLKRYQIEQCILRPAKAMTYITGMMHFKFQIAVDGTVTIKVLRNDVGHHEIEECIEGIARSLHFGRPKGGKVIINYPLRIPNRGTPHIKWGKARVRSVMKGRRSAIKACKKGRRPRRFTIHFYVLPGGRVIAAGVWARKGRVPQGFAACVLTALQQATFPDPLGKVAKVSYRF